MTKQKIKLLKTLLKQLKEQKKQLLNEVPGEKIYQLPIKFNIRVSYLPNVYIDNSWMNSNYLHKKLTPIDNPEMIVVEALGASQRITRLLLIALKKKFGNQTVNVTKLNEIVIDTQKDGKKMLPIVDNIIKETLLK